MAGKVNKKDDRDTRNRIMDAAEEMFWKKGYYGATVREIFDLADANRGLLSYYFESKEKLFEATIERRFSGFRTRFLEQLEAARRGAGAVLSVRDFCRAYIRFLLDMAHDPDPGWRNYIKFLAVANSAYDSADVSAQLDKFNFVIGISICELERSLPTADRKKIERSLLFLETSTSTLIATDRLWEERIHRAGSAAYEELVEEMSAFFASAVTIHCM